MSIELVGKKLINKNNAVPSAIKSHRNPGITRNRFLLKRSFKAWRESTFGRLSPSDAREYYEKRVKSQCLAVLKAFQKNSRKEWKLWIRAEYHDRFRIWQYYFKHWVTFVDISKRNKKQSQLAIEHGRKTFMKKCWCSWTVFVKIQKKQKKMDQVSALQYNTTVIRKVWTIWLHRFNNECSLKNMNYIALNHWATSVTAKIFFLWRNRYLDNCDLQKKMGYSEAFHNQKIAEKAVLRWKQFIRVCKEKKQVKALADDTFLKTQLHVFFKKWRTSYGMQVHVRETEEYIVDHGKRCIKRRYFNQLLKYRETKIYYRQMLEDATLTYQANLKKNCLIRLERYANECKRKNGLQEMANKFRNDKMCSHCFSIWMKQCEHHEDLKQYPLSRIAYQYYRSRALTRSLFCWTRFVKKRKQKARLYQLASLHHNQRILPRCFTAWVKFCEMEKVVNQMQTVALQFNRELLLSKSYFTWLKFFKIASLEKDLQQQAITHHTQVTLRTAFGTWRHQMETLQFISKLEVTAVTCFNNRLSRSYFQKWILKSREAVSLKLKWEKSTEFRIESLKRRHWSVLKQYWCLKKTRRAKEAMSVEFYTHKISKTAIISWKAFTINAKEINSICEHRYKQKGLVLCSWVLSRWKLFVETSKMDKRKQEMSINHHQRWLLQNAFARCRVYAAKRTQSRYLEDESIVRAELKIQKGLQRAFFLKWRLLSDVSRHERSNSVIALQHYWRITGKKMLHHWRIFVFHSYKSKIMRSQCIGFYRLNTEKRFFQVWRAKFNNRCAEKHRSNVSIWWWSYRLQKKVLIGMRKYAAEKRQKKLLYKQALRFRTEMLVETGVMKWIQYSAGVMERRRQIACQENIKNSMTLQARVRLYALRWLRKTRKAIEQRGLAPLINIGFTEQATIQQTPMFSESTIRSNKQITTLHSNSYKPFDVQIPTVRERPSPRLPEYLRESFDLRRFRGERTLKICSPMYEYQPREDTHIPVTMLKTDLRWSTDSAKALAITDDEEASSNTQHSTCNKTLLPPSCFQKKGSVSLKP